MDNKSTTIIILVSISLCSVFVIGAFIFFAQFGSWILKKSRITNRKQFSRRKVAEELQHNVRYNTPDSLSVSLAAVQPFSSRRQTLPAISICQPQDEFSSNNRQISYGSIELIRSKVRRFSEVGFSPKISGETSRKISLDSATLTRICEESTEMYEIESNRNRRASTSSYMDKNSAVHSEIDVDLYSSTDDITSQSPMFGCGLGRLYFVVNYNRSLGNMYVTIVKATYVRSSVVKETSCVYIKVTLLDPELSYPVQRSNCVTSMGNPMFNQTFTFHISSKPEQLQLTVKEVRKLERNRIIGYVWFDLTHMMKSNPGLITSQEISREIFGENKLYRRRGDVLVNMKISVLEAIEINICIVEARNLVIRHQNISVYVRASLLVKHKVIHTKKGQPVKRSISSPNFNDRFRFIIPKSKDFSILDECCIILCFCSRSRVRFSHLIGRCVIGPIQYTEGEGLLQWNECVNKPGNCVSQWLSLT